MLLRHALNAVICVTVSLAGCQTTRPVEFQSHEALIGKLARNDDVRIWLRDGRVLDLKIAAIEADALRSAEQRIPLAQIERIERREFSAWRTTGLVVAFVCGALVLGLAFAAHSGPVGIPPGTPY